MQNYKVIEKHSINGLDFIFRANNLKEAIEKAGKWATEDGVKCYHIVKYNYDGSVARYTKLHYCKAI